MLIGDHVCGFPEGYWRSQSQEIDSAIAVVEFQKVIGDRKVKKLIGDRYCYLNERNFSE